MLSHKIGVFLVNTSYAVMIEKAEVEKIVRKSLSLPPNESVAIKVYNNGINRSFTKAGTLECLERLSECHVVIFFNGWEQSTLARTEYEAARLFDVDRYLCEGSKDRLIRL